MKKIIQSIVWLGLVGWLVIKFTTVFITISAIIMFLILVILIANRKEIIARRKFFRVNDGKYFLWYSSNKKYKEKIENHLIPLLSEIEFSIIYNNKNNVESSLDGSILRSFRDETYNSKLPILFKIKNGKIYSESFYKEIRQARIERLPVAEFNEKVLVKLKKLQ